MNESHLFISSVIGGDITLPQRQSLYEMNEIVVLLCNICLSDQFWPDLIAETCRLICASCVRLCFHLTLTVFFGKIPLEWERPLSYHRYKVTLGYLHKVHMVQRVLINRLMRTRFDVQAYCFVVTYFLFQSWSGTLYICTDRRGSQVSLWIL